MSKIKQLASQTIWYGASSILARFISYFLSILLTYLLHTPKGMTDFGNISILYGWIAVAKIVFTYGFETSYFRYSNVDGINKKSLFQTSFTSLFFSSLLLFLFLNFIRYPISRFTDQDGHPEYITLSLLVLFFDTLSAIPLAKLRQENRPRRFAFVNVSGVVVNVISTVFFVYYVPKYALIHPDAWIVSWYHQHTNVYFVLLANLFQSLVSFLLLLPQWHNAKLKINKKLWKQLWSYGSPMIIIGLAGMVNEVMDRTFLNKLLPYDHDTNTQIVGIYSANYKMSIIITLFIQAFKMAAEPFFFNQSKDQDAPRLYARVMKWFVIVVSLAFLITVLYIDVWKYLVGPQYRSGLGIVPILLMANIFLGIYYTQSVWYKLSNKMLAGMYITLGGAVITIVINVLFIPRYGMYASAWATFICYASMMVISYFAGHKYYPIPYNVKKLLSYLTVMLLFYFIQKGMMSLWSNVIFHLVTGSLLLLAYLALIVFAEKKELSGFPVIGSYIRRKIK